MLISSKGCANLSDSCRGEVKCEVSAKKPCFFTFVRVVFVAHLPENPHAL